jgi:hypothetical protein
MKMLDLINAGKQTITTCSEQAFDSAFSLEHGQHAGLNNPFGAMEVAEMVILPTGKSW